MCSDSSGYALLCCTLPSMGHAAFFSSFFWHPHYFCLSLITLCPLFSSTWYPFSPHLSHCMYITITSLVYYPNSNRHVSSGIPSLQCSCTFCHKTYTRLFLYSFCCASRGLAICAAFSFSTLLNLLSCTSPFTEHTSLSSYYAFCGLATCTALFFLTYNGHSLHLCPFSLYLKHWTSTTPTLLIILSSTPHCITLLFNISNLFWEMTVPSSSFVPIVSGQVPKPFITLTQFSSPFFKFCP